MAKEELKKILNEIGISQTDFAKLIGMTPRAVSLWMVGDRGVPPAAMAYARLLAGLPLNLQQFELAKLKQKGVSMREGMYGVGFNYGADAGVGILTFEGGRVYGADVGGAKYDGDYTFNEKTGLADVRVKVTFPPNGYSVFGIVNPYEWSIDVAASLDPKLNEGSTQVKTSIGRELPSQYRYLRPLPDAA